MRVCIRCNPVSVLISAPDGDYCYLHGLDYVAEDRADLVGSPDVTADEPVVEQVISGAERPAEGF